MIFNASLYLVPTPIGNLGDITLRALEVLKAVDYVLAEDTRTSGVLFKYYEIKTSLRSHHIHNEHQQVAKVISDLKEGKKIALISDAGTPAISDPGFLLVRECLAQDVAVECLPGATAFVPALVNSGQPTDRFVFEGFLPVKKGRATRLQTLSAETRTMIFYESPHRILKTLQQFSEHFGAERQASVSRELTKLYEETINGTLTELIEKIGDKKQKGEFVIVVAGKEK